MLNQIPKTEKTEAPTKYSLVGADARDVLLAVTLAFENRVLSFLRFGIPHKIICLLETYCFKATQSFKRKINFGRPLCNLHSVLLAIAFVFAPFLGFSQADRPEEENDSTSAIKLADIQQHHQRLVSEIPLMLEPYSNSTLVQSSILELEWNSTTLNSVKLEADEILSGYISPSQITNLQSRLNRSRVNLERLSSKMKNITTDIEKSLSVLRRSKLKWNAVLYKTNTDSLFMALLPQVQEVLALTTSAEKKLQNHLLEFLALQNKINQSQNDIIKYGEQVEKAQALSFTRLFQRDNVSLWNRQTEDTTMQGVRTKSVSENLTLNASESVEYINERSSTFIWILILGVGLYMIMFFLQRPQRNTSQNSDLFSPGGLAVKYPIASASITVLLTTILCLPNRPALVTQLLLIAFALPVLIFSLHTNVKNRWIFWTIIVAYVMRAILYLNALPSLAQHIMLILLNLLVIALTYWMYRNQDKYLTHINGTSIKHIKTILVPVYFFLSTLTFILILVGYLSLAKLILSGVVVSLYVAPVVLLCAHVVISFLHTLSKTTMLNKSRIVSRYLSFVFKLLGLGAWYLWIKSLMVAFGLDQFFISAAIDFWKLGANFGEFHVTVGGVVGTVIIILLSFLISNFIKVLLEEEVLSRLDVPRGVPMAMGVLGKYVVIVIGFFLAIASAGVDLTKMSILVGALGVGVGFGLQNLVSNFVSGMILIFERPILVGDIIEADGLEGSVSEIGIRSSKIVTYAGSEVIIPNANLVSNSVSNWTLSNRRRRSIIEIKTHGSANPAQVVEVLRSLAVLHANVMKDPAPFAVFEGQRDQTLLFKLYYWQDRDILITRGELNLRIYDSLKRSGIELTIPAIQIKT